jgi:membrane-associated phospholipid phosphatase
VDDAVVIRLNRWARRNPASARTIGFAAERLAAVEVSLMVLLALSGWRGSALRMLLAVGAIYAACETVGRVVPRQRPFERIPKVSSLAQHKLGRSFPSRHVASGLAMAAIGSRDHPRLGRLMTAVAWLLGVSRVAAGLHYPSDIVAGALLGEIIGRCIRNA